MYSQAVGLKRSRSHALQYSALVELSMLFHMPVSYACKEIGYILHASSILKGASLMPLCPVGFQVE